MNIYLDIDGVLVTHGRPTAHAIEFLEEVTAHYDCYWLTTHSRGGENRATEYLLRILPPETENLLQRIRPTYWRSLKTEVIDFTKDFRWIDDILLTAEMNELIHYGCVDKFIQVDIKRNPNQLKEILQNIKS